MYRLIFNIVSLVFLLTAGFAVQAQNAKDIVRASIDHWRGLSSYAEITMTIHRPDWERSMSMRAWTEGEKRSLVRVTAPQRDRGNGTLTDGNSMWSFSPKINRIIKVPSSMMNQGWMGSDLSNKDISRADDIVDLYDHTLLSSTEIDGHIVYEIRSIPKEDAAVVWGKEILFIRDDYVLIMHRYYDQNDALVKQFESLEINDMGGRTVAVRQRMGKIENLDEWTEIQTNAIEFDITMDSYLFTLSNLRNPRN